MDFSCLGHRCANGSVVVVGGRLQDAFITKLRCAMWCQYLHLGTEAQVGELQQWRGAVWIASYSIPRARTD